MLARRADLLTEDEHMTWYDIMVHILIQFRRNDLRNESRDLGGANHFGRARLIWLGPRPGPI